MNEKNQLEVIHQNEIAIVDTSPIASYQMILAQGGNVNDLKEMLEFQKLFEAVEAKKAYTKAMASFKADPPTIGKDMRVSYKNTNYSHASLGNVTKQINKALGEHGLSASWPLDQTNGGIKVTCVITHELGHSESTSLTAGADGTGSKNDIQAMGSTISYLQRYTILALTGLATEDQDDDGQTAEIQYITEKQVSEITDSINNLYSTPEDIDGFMKHCGIESVETIPAKDYNKIVSIIKASS